MTHCIQKKKAISKGRSRQNRVCYNTKYRCFRRTICQERIRLIIFYLFKLFPIGAWSDFKTEVEYEDMMRRVYLLL